MSVVGLDVGDVRIGIAISEDLSFAHPFQTIERMGLKKDIQHLCRIVVEKDVETIVVGLPKRLNGEIGIQAKKVQGFSRRLEKNTRAKIVFWDERLTTVGAERIFQKMAANRKKHRKKVVDQIAAVLILEGYLSQFNRSYDLPENA